MNKKQFAKWMLVLTSLLLLGVTAFATLSPAAWAYDEDNEEAYPHIKEFEVAEDGTRFVSDEAPVIVGGELDGFPAYGAAFMTQGYIYPAGTLNGSNGTNPDGSPEFPDKVIGEWTCWGYHVGDGAATTTGPIVVTTQLFSFGEEFGSQTIVSVGYELADANVPFKRAITGGTGRFAKARGELVQTFLGLDEDPFGVNLHYKLKLR